MNQASTGPKPKEVTSNLVKPGFDAEVKFEQEDSKLNGIINQLIQAEDESRPE
jgi:hypothetical protein